MSWKRQRLFWGVATLLVAACGAPADDPAALVDIATLQERIAAPRDEALLVVFWATWCGPCIDEIPVLQELHADPGLELQVLSVSLDSFLEGPEGGRQLVVDFLARTPMPWQQVVYEGGQDELFEPFRMSGGIPFSVLYDAHGREIGRFSGRFAPEQVRSRLAEAHS